MEYSALFLKENEEPSVFDHVVDLMDHNDKHYRYECDSATHAEEIARWFYAVDWEESDAYDLAIFKHDDFSYSCEEIWDENEVTYE